MKFSRINRPIKKMNKIKLTYFDVNGGRGEPIRLALHLGNIDFEDFRFPFSEFAEVRKTTPLGQVPTLELNELQITQCNGILRYIGKQANLYPKDDLQALLCDEVLGIVEDALQKLVMTFGLEGENLKAAREKLVKHSITPALKLLEKRLSGNGGEFFAGKQLTIADLKVFIWVRSLIAGHLDHIPTNLVETHAPGLIQHFNSLERAPAIADYYSKIESS